MSTLYHQHQISSRLIKDLSNALDLKILFGKNWKSIYRYDVQWHPVIKIGRKSDSKEPFFYVNHLQLLSSNLKVSFLSLDDSFLVYDFWRNFFRESTHVQRPFKSAFPPEAECFSWSPEAKVCYFLQVGKLSGMAPICFLTTQPRVGRLESLNFKSPDLHNKFEHYNARQCGSK